MIEENYLKSTRTQFQQYKELGEKAMSQIPEDKFHWKYNDETNSISVIIQHLCGNMISRFTDFFTSDGEKPWRNRDSEFEDFLSSKIEIMAFWDKGWSCLLNTLNDISPEDLIKTVLIRNEPHTVMEAFNRQLTHYASHVGQIILLCKMIAGDHWTAITIPKNKSADFNAKHGL